MKWTRCGGCSRRSGESGIARAPQSLHKHPEWLEFIHAKTSVAPSCTGEYSNAVSCIAELIEKLGEREAYRKLLLEHGMSYPPAPPVTRIEQDGG
jgi:hypothetical protein